MFSIRAQHSAAALREAGADAPNTGAEGHNAPPAQSEGAPRRRHSALWAIVHQSCPRCREGRIFRGLFEMNDPCLKCGLLFEREEGYFLGAMYISYGMSSVILIAYYIAASYLLPDWSSISIAFLVVVPYLPLVPLVLRYSRVIWIYLERCACPSDMSAGVWEKQKLKEIAARRSATGSR
jgi:uncharacterized protein (DUF983 family)